MGEITSGNITLSPLNGIVGANVIPSTNKQVDLGISTNQWRNLYTQSIYSNGVALTFGGFWQELTGALSPIQQGDDLLLGSSATTSAKFAFTGLMGANPQASFSGNFIVMPYTSGANENGGNVGIGTTTPLATLSVAGTGLFQSLSASSSAFQVQNANGAPVFLIDTTNSINLLSNPGFEIGLSGWSLRNGSTISWNKNKTFIYHGQSSLKVATSTSANSGASTNSFTITLGAGTYTLSFYAMLSSGTLTTLNAGYNQGSGDVNCILNNTTVKSTGFQRYSCTFTTTNTLSNIYIDQGTGTTAINLFIDAVQLQTGGLTTPYQIGSIQLRGIINAPVAIQPTADSVSVFQIQNAAGNNNLFIADTLDNAIGIGTNTLLATLDIRGLTNTIAAASVSGQTTFAALVVNNNGNGDLFTASASGWTRFTITNAGQLGLVGGLNADIDTLTSGTTFKIGTTNAGTITLGRSGQSIVLPGFTGSNAVMYSNNGTLSVANTGTSGQCLISSGGGNPGWSGCAASGGAGGNYWYLDQVNGTMYSIFPTTDFLWGGLSSASATFKLTGQTIQAGVLPVASISAHTSYAALVVDNTVGDLITASVSGQTKFVVRQNGSVGIGTGTGASSGFTLDVLGNARIGSSNTSGNDIFKSTTSDFTQSGYAFTPATIDGVAPVSTTGNQLTLVTDLLGAGGTLTAPAAGTGTGQNIGAGAVAFQREDSRFVLVAGGGSNTTRIYDQSGNAFTAGPTLPLNATSGTNAFQRPDSKFMILIGGTNQSAIYTATGSATSTTGTMNTGPTLTANVGPGSLVLRRSDGKFIVILGNSTAVTNIYDPTAFPIAVPGNPSATDSGSFIAGPGLTGNVTTGSFAFETVNGKWIVGIGGSSTTNIYDPVSGLFSSGPSLASSQTTGAGAHVIQRPDSKYMLILGNGNTPTGTQIYDPASNAWTVGTATLTASANTGSHSFQRSDGKWITVLGGGSSITTNLYDPTNGAGGAYSDPGSSYYLYSGYNAGAGALTFQRPDGKYIIVSGNGAQNFTVYDGGWNTTGAWTSEQITTSNISTYSAIMWTGDSQATNNNARLDKSTTVIAVKSAANVGALSGANWVSIPNSGQLIGANGPVGAVQVQITFNAPVRSYPQLVDSYINQSNIWGGEGFTFNRRTFLQPSIYTIRISDPLVQYGGLASDPSYGRNFATAGALLEGVVTDNNNQLTLATNRNLPTATNSAGFMIASSSGALGGTAGAGSNTIQLPNGQFLVLLGGSTNSRIYDPDSNTFSAGPSLGSTNCGSGCHSVQLPSGQFFVILAGGSTNTRIYDPVSNTFVAGPQLANAANTGSITFQRPDGLFVNVAGSGMYTNIYDPFLNQFTAGPSLTCSAGAGTIAMIRPDGRVSVVCGGTVTGNTYDAALNAFNAGPNMSAGTLVAGSLAIQLSTGRYLIKTSALLTQTLDPVTNTFTAGPTVGFTEAAGSFVIPRPDGKILLAQGGSVATQIYDPDAGATGVTGAFTGITSSPSLPCVTGAGAHVFQRPDGAFVLICGGGTPNVAIIDAGWNLGGSYFSEEIPMHEPFK